MHYESKKPIISVVIFIGLASFLGLTALWQEGNENDIQVFEIAQVTGLSSPSRAMRLRPSGRTQGRMDHSSLLQSGPSKPQTSLSFRLANLSGELAPKEATITLTEMIPEAQERTPPWNQSAICREGAARFTNLPLNREFQVEVRSHQLFPCVFTVEGPKTTQDELPFEIPLQERRLRCKLYGDDDRLLNYEWVIVDLFTGQSPNQARRRIPTQGIDKNGILQLILFHPPKGEFRLRLSQDEGKELSRMSRTWIELGPSTPSTSDLGEIKLTQPPLFASGTMHKEDGKPLGHVRFQVFRQTSYDGPWELDPSMATSADYKGNWTLRAELGCDLLKIMPLSCGQETREELFIPRGTTNLGIHMYPTEDF